MRNILTLSALAVVATLTATSAFAGPNDEALGAPTALQYATMQPAMTGVMHAGPVALFYGNGANQTVDSSQTVDRAVGSLNAGN
ncbi:MAG: hypothetical protein KGQ46_03965 [Hyphomicrobiales bacterium]|nr:hypothetical protein [Hyphomicrobiales bacterium]MDE2114968.1 hypothetical protein [Hyphomicrobiales bacterium]